MRNRWQINKTVTAGLMALAFLLGSTQAVAKESAAQTAARKEVATLKAVSAAVRIANPATAKTAFTSALTAQSVGMPLAEVTALWEGPMGILHAAANRKESPVAIADLEKAVAENKLTSDALFDAVVETAGNNQTVTVPTLVSLVTNLRTQETAAKTNLSIAEGTKTAAKVTTPWENPYEKAAGIAFYTGFDFSGDPWLLHRKAQILAGVAKGEEGARLEAAAIGLIAKKAQSYCEGVTMSEGSESCSTVMAKLMVAMTNNIYLGVVRGYMKFQHRDPSGKLVWVQFPARNPNAYFRAMWDLVAYAMDMPSAKGQLSEGALNIALAMAGYNLEAANLSQFGPAWATARATGVPSFWLMSPEAVKCFVGHEAYGAIGDTVFQLPVAVR